MAEEILEKIYMHGLHVCLEGSLGRLIKLLAYFETAHNLWQANKHELLSAGLEPEISDRLLKNRHGFDLVREAEKLAGMNIRLLGRGDEGYPTLLTQISQPPALLYVRGHMPDSQELCVAVVGTRKISTYGRTVLPYLLGPIIDAGAVVVSGLAYGVDSAVQQLAVEKGRRTIAVLGGGLDEKTFYPKEHVWLAEKIIAAGGALISEYPPGTPPLKHHFLARNRILSGMSAATVVVECDTKSGSLITAQHALEQNRALFAVPGPIYAPTSQGPNNLIKMGARPLTEPKDLFEELNLETYAEEKENQHLFGDSPAESAILQVLGLEPMATDTIIQQSGLPAGDVRSALTFLEMKGRVRNLGGQQYVRSK